MESFPAFCLGPAGGCWAGLLGWAVGCAGLVWDVAAGAGAGVGLDIDGLGVQRKQ